MSKVTAFSNGSDQVHEVRIPFQSKSPPPLLITPSLLPPPPPRCLFPSQDLTLTKAHVLIEIKPCHLADSAVSDCAGATNPQIRFPPKNNPSQHPCHKMAADRSGLTVLIPLGVCTTSRDKHLDETPCLFRGHQHCETYIFGFHCAGSDAGQFLDADIFIGLWTFIGHNKESQIRLKTLYACRTSCGD